MSDSNDIQNIHRRYTLTLINPASFYVSLCGSIAVASIISFLCFNNYIQNYEIFYHLPAVVAVLLAIQYLDSRFTKHKEYSKSLHMSFFGNILWLITIVGGIIGSAILSKEPTLFYVAIGMFIFSSFRIGIMTTTLGVNMKKACVLCFIQPLAMFFVLIPIEMWSVLYDVQSLVFGIAFLAVAVVWSYFTNRSGLPVIKSTHKLLQAYLQSVSQNDPSDMESIISETSKPSNISTSQIRFSTNDDKNDFRMILPDLHPGPFHPVGGSDIPHVVDSANKATVTFLDGSQYSAEIIGEDKFTDIAVIKVNEKPRLLHPLQIGDSSLLQVGEQVAAIGNPFGLSGSMTSGIISQIGRLISAQDSGFSIPDVIQTDAAINPGNSGGPLLNMKGQVIGINTAIQSRTGEFVGIGFAVPSNTVSKIVPALIEDGKYHHPWIGITGKDIDPDLARVLELKQAKGFLIITVVDGSPADKAGLKGVSETYVVDDKEYPVDGDIIISVDDKEVRKISDILTHLQREKSVGDTMMLGVLRDGEFMHISLELVERPDL